VPLTVSDVGSLISRPGTMSAVLVPWPVK